MGLFQKIYAWFGGYGCKPEGNKESFVGQILVMVYVRYIKKGGIIWVGVTSK
jgi:hypothetical protein